MKYVSLVIISAWLWLIPAISPVSADEDFTKNARITYTISEDGSNEVEHQIELINNTSSAYASKYALDIYSNNLNQISITNLAGEEIPYQHTLKNDISNLFLEFPNPVVGKGKTQSIKINYTNPEASQRNGNIVEINIPKIVNPDQFDQFLIQIVVPISLGEPSFISPSNYTLESDAALTRITFDKESISKSGGLIIFGTEQYFDLELYYPLSNDSITPVDTQFAIPPDTPYQKVYLNQINPLPIKLQPDSDGNWIATFRLEAREEIVVRISQTITVRNQPTFTKHVLSSDLNQYLSEQPFWPNTNQIINSQQLTSPREIYDYITAQFSYNYGRIDNQSTARLGAAQALIDPKNSLCLEFADTFIALSRSNNIPARLLTGYAYTANPNTRPLSLVQNSLHAWAEYYDLETQVFRSVDPTWGQTTGGVDYFNSFDFNHVVFAINGISSQSPFPAGYTDASDQQLNITFAETPPQEILAVDATLIVPALTRLGLSEDISIELSSNSNTAIHDENLKIYNSQGQLLVTQPVEILLPMSQHTVQLQIQSLHDINNPLQIKYADYEQTQNLPWIPAHTGVIIFFLTTTTAILIGIFATRSRGILVSQPK